MTGDAGGTARQVRHQPADLLFALPSFRCGQGLLEEGPALLPSSSTQAALPETNEQVAPRVERPRPEPGLAGLAIAPARRLRVAEPQPAEVEVGLPGHRLAQAPRRPVGLPGFELPLTRPQEVAAVGSVVGQQGLDRGVGGRISGPLPSAGEPAERRHPSRLAPAQREELLLGGQRLSGVEKGDRPVELSRTVGAGEELGGCAGRVSGEPRLDAGERRRPGRRRRPVEPGRKDRELGHEPRRGHPGRPTILRGHGSLLGRRRRAARDGHVMRRPSGGPSPRTGRRSALRSPGRRHPGMHREARPPSHRRA